MMRKFRGVVDAINWDEVFALLLILGGINGFIYWGWQTLAR